MNPLVRAARGLRRRWREWRVRGWPDGLAWKRIPAGLWMRLDRRDFADLQYYFHDVDFAFVRDIRRLVRPGECAVDLGAQKGFQAMLLARAVGHEGVVLAVEPDPRAAALLADHRTRNGLRQIRIEQVAAGEIDSTIEIALSTQLGWTSRYPNAMQKLRAESTVRVPLRKVDSIVATLRDPSATPVSFVKVDIEGSETAALAGMRETLARHAPMLWMEVSETSLASSGSSAAAIDTLLLPLGYRVIVPEWTEPEPLVRRRRIWYREAPRIEGYPGGDQFDVLLVSPRYMDRVSPLLRVGGNDRPKE